MNLSKEQIEKVKLWLAEGDKLSQVQSKILSEFGISLTYMEVRFLVDDIGAEIVDNSQEKEVPQDANQSASDAASTENQTEPDAKQEGAKGEVQVELSPIQRPGALASGDVVFSDGVKSAWILDQTGRLSLVPPNADYSPPQDDLPVFQKKLQELFSQM